MRAIDESIKSKKISPAFVDLISFVSIIISSKLSYDSISITLRLSTKDISCPLANFVPNSHMIIIVNKFFSFKFTSTFGQIKSYWLAYIPSPFIIFKLFIFISVYIS